MSTLLLSRGDVLRCMDALSLLEDMRAAFRADAAAPRLAEPQLPRAAPPGLPALEVAFPGVLPGLAASTVSLRVTGEAPSASRPGLIHLYSDTGALLALLDASHLAALRTGVVGALAADMLARPESSRVAMLGAGPQASLQLKSLRLVRSLQYVRVYDKELPRAAELAARLYSALNLPVHPAVSVEEAVEDADIVIVALDGALDSREPVLLPGMVRAGTHIQVGAARPGFAPLSAGLVRQSTVFCDHRALHASRGLPASVGLGAEVLQAELGEVLTGQKPGRTDPGQVTLFGSLGLPFQDLVAAWHVYQVARDDEDVRRMDFGA